MIYFILDEKTGFVKIGRSKNGGAARLAQLQTGHPSALVLVGELDAPDELEQQLHEAFAAVRERGEWFRLKSTILRLLLGLHESAYEAKLTRRVEQLTALEGVAHGPNPSWRKRRKKLPPKPLTFDQKLMVATGICPPPVPGRCGRFEDCNCDPVCP